MGVEGNSIKMINKILFFTFLLIITTLHGQAQNDVHFCENSSNNYVEIKKIPRFIEKYIRENSNQDKYLLYKQHNKLVQTSNIKLYYSDNEFLIRYSRNTSLLSNDLIIAFSIQNRKVLHYSVIGNKCLNKEDINSMMKCNCESALLIFPKESTE